MYSKCYKRDCERQKQQQQRQRKQRNKKKIMAEALQMISHGIERMLMQFFIVITETNYFECIAKMSSFVFVTHLHLSSWRM